ncbi:SGNH/GDSL hydrolase family protein [Salipiger sp.]|uniref:SGNH/GDSL hydrolase family protein n=1 Tax=Salipiger sp. TaxID=2078585 RepID=UPI003A978F06
MTFLLLPGCTERAGPGTQSRILLMGDSMMAANRNIGLSVADAIESRLGESVIDRSVPAARILHALPISGSLGLDIDQQYQAGSWDWVVLNGGGNDLLFGCGCALCDHKIDRLISADGRRGAIPGLVSRLRHGGARVIYTGYLRSPGRWSLIDGCRAVGNELDRRIARLAGLDRGVFFLALDDLVPFADRSYHAPDLIHPSPKGSDAIGRRIAALIDAAG